MRTLRKNAALAIFLIAVLPFVATASTSVKSLLPNSIGFEFGGDLVMDGSLSLGWHGIAKVKYTGALYAGVRVSPIPGEWEDTGCPFLSNCDPSEYHKISPNIHWGLYAGFENNSYRRIRTRVECRANAMSGPWQHVLVDYLVPHEHSVDYVGDYVDETGNGTLYTWGVLGSAGVLVYSGLECFVTLGVMDVIATSESLDVIEKHPRIRGSVGLRFTRLR